MNKLKYLCGGVVLLAVLLASVSGCTKQDTAGEPKQDVKTGHYAVNASDVREINIDVKDRAIEITESPDEDIMITYYENDKEFYDILLDGDKVLSMKAASDKNLSDYVGFSDDSMQTIKLEVPNPLLSNLVISSTKNDIKLPDLRFEGNIKIDINDGEIELENTTPLGDVTLSAKNGDISGTLKGKLDDFKITSNAHKGKSNLPDSKEDGTQALEVKTNNGDIDLAFVD